MVELLRLILGQRPAERFTPVTVNEYGQIGPQAVDLVDLIASRAHDPVTLKTCTMRRLAGVTATHVHRQLFGRVRGHAALAPAEQRAAGPALPDLVADDMAEQTACADDAMAEEERYRASGRRRQRRARAPAGAGVPGGTATEAAAAGGEGEGGEGDQGQGGLGASGRAATL